MHFSAVLGIKQRDKIFQPSYNYTTHLAALIWMSRLIMLEYALPKREYTTLGLPSRAAYVSHGSRLASVRRAYLTSGSYCPVADLVRLLAFGREVTKRDGRPGVIQWDEDKQGLKIKDLHLRLDEFRQFVQELIKSLQDIMRNDLFFDAEPPSFTLSELNDIMLSDNKRPEESIRHSEKKKDEKEGGHHRMMKFMMNQGDVKKRLMDDNGRWNERKVRQYLISKKRFLRLLMVGTCLIHRSSLD